MITEAADTTTSELTTLLDDYVYEEADRPSVTEYGWAMHTDDRHQAATATLATFTANHLTWWLTGGLADFMAAHAQRENGTMADQIPFEKLTREWWSRLTDDQRARIRKAAGDNDTSSVTAKLLADTRCPVGLIGTAWEADPEYTWSWPKGMRDFIADQP
jgi:hypothetical protein